MHKMIFAITLALGTSVAMADKVSDFKDAKKAADDLPTAIADARKTIQAATDLIQKASTGKGALPTLLSNQELANDLKALVTNLRAHGVLFYRDDAAKAETPRAMYYKSSWVAESVTSRPSARRSRPPAAGRVSI